MTRVARLVLSGVLPLLALACAEPAPPPTIEARNRQSIAAACREEATRVILFRDRGQQMRIDDGVSSIGVQSDIPTLRAQTDRLGATFERDRIARDCERQANTAQTPTPAPAPTPPPAGRPR
jgi:hypothetical protein